MGSIQAISSGNTLNAITLSNIGKALIDTLAAKVSNVAGAILGELAKAKNYVLVGIPCVFTALSLYSLVKKSLMLSRAIQAGSVRDIKRYCLDVLRDVFNLLCYTTATLQSLGSIFNLVSKNTVSITRVVSNVLGIIVDSIHLVREAIHLHASRKTAKMMDEILENPYLSEKQKIKKILENLKTQFDDRREYDEKICGNSLEDLKEWTKTFVSQQSKVELSQIFGAHAYEKLSEAINLFAKEVAGTEEFFEKSLSTIRVSRHLLDSQIKRKWIEISMDVVSIAAQALCIAFPVMTIPTIMVYTLWSSYGVMMAALKLIDKSDEKFLARQIEKAIPTVQLKEIEKFENELMNDSAFQSIESLAKNPIANNLLKVRTFEKFKKVASKRMLEKIAKEMKVLLHEAKVPDVRIKKTAFNSIKDLRNAFLKYRDLFITNNGSIVNKAESLRQQIVILNNINDAFYEKVLKIKMRNL